MGHKTIIGASVMCKGPRTMSIFVGSMGLGRVKRSCHLSCQVAGRELRSLNNHIDQVLCQPYLQRRNSNSVIGKTVLHTS